MSTARRSILTVESKQDRLARIAAEKARHDSAIGTGFPAIRRPRVVQACIPNQWLDMQRAKARSFPSSTVAARVMGVSRRRAASLRAKK